MKTRLVLFCLCVLITLCGFVLCGANSDSRILPLPSGPSRPLRPLHSVPGRAWRGALTWLAYKLGRRRRKPRPMPRLDGVAPYRAAERT
jgi:hypothetical protein